MTTSLPNPFLESAPSSSRADTLAAHVDHAAVLSIREAQRELSACRTASDEVAATISAFMAAPTTALALSIIAAGKVFRAVGTALSEELCDIRSQMAFRSFASNSTFIPTT